MQSTSKPIVFNFLPVKTGGGLQNTLSFLTLLVLEKNLAKDSLVLCNAGSAVEIFCKEKDLDYFAVAATNLARLKFELLTSKSVVGRNAVVFTLFGPPLLRRVGRVNINGCAYSNLLYPELTFWWFLPAHKRALKAVIDFYRKRMLARSDVIVFETEVLVERAKKDRLFSSKQIELVEMAPSALVDKDRITDQKLGEFNATLCSAEGFTNVLYLSGAQPNKRHALWPQIIKSLADKGCLMRLVTTISEGSYLESLESKFKDLGIPDHLYNIGPVQSEEVPSLIAATDMMCNIALLESFSNNFVESWRMGKPLIVTDADWSRRSCGNAALYIDPVDPEQSSEKIERLLKTDEAVQNLIDQGELQLQNMPSREQRFAKYVEIINRCL